MKLINKSIMKLIIKPVVFWFFTQVSLINSMQTDLHGVGTRKATSQYVTP